MKPILFTLIFAFLLLGCQKKESQAQHDARIAQQAREALLAELHAKKIQAKAPLSSFGIETHDSKIIIDTNQTEHFFKEMATKMRAKVQSVSKNLEHGIIDEEEAGISITEHKLLLDFNKTKHFLEHFNQKMQSFVKEFDTIAKKIEHFKGESCNQ